MPDDGKSSKSEAKREDDSPLPSDTLANHDTHVQSGADLEGYTHEQQRERVARGEPADNFTGASLAGYAVGHAGQVRDPETGEWKESDSLRNHATHLQTGASLADHETHLQTGADLEAYAQERDRERIARGGKADDFTGASLADYGQGHAGQVRDPETGEWKESDSLRNHDTHLQSGASLLAHEASLADHSTAQVQRDRAAGKTQRKGDKKTGRPGEGGALAPQTPRTSTDSDAARVEDDGAHGSERPAAAFSLQRRSSFSVAALRHTARNSFAASLQIASRMNSFQAGRAIARR